MIPQDKRDQAHALARTIERLFAPISGQETSAALLAGDADTLVKAFDQDPNAEDIVAALKTEHRIELKGDPAAKAGFFTILHAVSGERLGRSGEKAAKTGFKLVFAIVPPGHTAPTHMHRDLPETPVGFGEITTTLQGHLLYVTTEGKIEVHSSGNEPRVSPSNSLDIYLENRDLWIGIYVQPENAAPLEGEAAAVEKVTRLLLERVVNQDPFLIPILTSL